MSLNRFDKIFGVETDLKTEQSKFVVRISQTLFSYIWDNHQHDYEKLMLFLCVEFGEKINDYRVSRGIGDERPPYVSLDIFSGIDFLKVLATIHLIFDFFSESKRTQDIIDLAVQKYLKMARTDLGVRWHKGMFFPAGAKELDERLIEDSFEWLEELPTVKVYFKESLDCFVNKKYKEQIGNIYNTMEEMARKILNNKKVLENNKAEFIAKLALPDQWSKILSNLIDYCNDYKRHASTSQLEREISPQEAEANLYLLGLFVRLVSTSI